MRMLRRRVGQASVVDAEATERMLEIYGDRVETPDNVPVFREEVLRELSRAAQEALATAGRADDK
jgi:sRNA-binding carbon storage regulator CsrA